MNQTRTKTALLILALGLWLISVACTFQRNSQEMIYSDVISGLVLIVLGICSLKPDRLWSVVGAGCVGFWLQFAPLVFWAPSEMIYLNDTLTGALVIALSFLFVKKTGAQEDLVLRNPLGWSYNPSAWNHRIPTVALAMVCWFFSRYMAAFQLGYIDQIYDPVFKDGTLNVITSAISRSFPVSDAGMGALCYTLEALLGWQGDEQRWYKRPWLVLFFGILVVPVGMASTTLIVLQPVIVGSWCFWCLATAALMLLMIVFTAGELVAVLQYLSQSRKSGRSLWSVFWKGGSADRESIPSLKSKGKGSWGITLPWNLIVTAALGVWLMISPSVTRVLGEISISDFIEGPLMIAISVIAMAEVFRSLRYINFLLGISLLVTAWVQPEMAGFASWNNSIVGAAAILLSFRKGPIKERYGSWEKFIF